MVGQTHPGSAPGKEGRWADLPPPELEKRAVRILLECFLVADVTGLQNVSSAEIWLFRDLNKGFAVTRYTGMTRWNFLNSYFSISLLQSQSYLKPKWRLIFCKVRAHVTSASVDKEYTADKIQKDDCRLKFKKVRDRKHRAMIIR